jgi:hypothetical protein
MTTQKIAVAVVHGVGSQKPEFAKAFADRLRARFAAEIAGLVPEPEGELQIRGVYWAKELADQERKLEERFHLAELRWGESREIMIDLGGDALAYQLNRQTTPQDPPGTYERIHMAFAGTLRALVADTDGEAPLCIVSHSLGTIIASNYLWDLQSDQVPSPVRSMMGGSPMESGRTLTTLYTMGSPIAVWSLRFPDFGVPIAFPPADLLDRYRDASVEWVNLYDQDDVIAYPLKVLNDRYNLSVTEDLPVNVGNLLAMWNPASHTGYWTDSDVVARAAAGLVRVWRSVNP